jgi:hypothetical protein
MPKQLWLIFMGMKRIFLFYFFEKKNPKWPFFKMALFFKISIFQKKIVKISWIGPWVNRID